MEREDVIWLDRRGRLWSFDGDHWVQCGDPAMPKEKADPFTDMLKQQIAAGNRARQMQGGEKTFDPALPENPGLGRVWGEK